MLPMKTTAHRTDKGYAINRPDGTAFEKRGKYALAATHVGIARVNGKTIHTMGEGAEAATDGIRRKVRSLTKGDSTAVITLPRTVEIQD